jgi:hypothetical protein
MTVANDAALVVTPDISVIAWVEGSIYKSVTIAGWHLVHVYDADEARLDAVFLKMWRKIEKKILVACNSMRKDAHTDKNRRFQAARLI